MNKYKKKLIIGLSHIAYSMTIEIVYEGLSYPYGSLIRELNDIRESIEEEPVKAENVSKAEYCQYMEDFLAQKEVFDLLDILTPKENEYHDKNYLQNLAKIIEQLKKE